MLGELLFPFRGFRCFFLALLSDLSIFVSSWTSTSLIPRPGITRSISGPRPRPLPGSVSSFTITICENISPISRRKFAALQL
jgi:hypothetical protein